MKKELRVRPIKNGTVIDHIAAGQALNVLKILGIIGQTDAVISAVTNVPSQAMGTKDIVKVEGRELAPHEVDKIALIAPSATINIVREYKVKEKHKVALPSVIEGLVRCANPNCISNTNEPVASRFIISKHGKSVCLRCVYCERIISENIAEHLL
ncbi:MAG: aspartate carbamoyltransferase regulatory subunit [Methanosarcinales archaeon]|nr:MAG: aspartate carbamoyltransferase regulatory subunit [Methanosarcinales archaeon]